MEPLSLSPQKPPTGPTRQECDHDAIRRHGIGQWKGYQDDFAGVGGCIELRICPVCGQGVGIERSIVQAAALYVATMGSRPVADHERKLLGPILAAVMAHVGIACLSCHGTGLPDEGSLDAADASCTPCLGTGLQPCDSCRKSRATKEHRYTIAGRELTDYFCARCSELS